MFHNKTWKKKVNRLENLTQNIKKYKIINIVSFNKINYYIYRPVEVEAVRNDLVFWPKNVAVFSK